MENSFHEHQFFSSDLWMNCSRRAGSSCLAYSWPNCHFYFRDFSSRACSFPAAGHDLSLISISQSPVPPLSGGEQDGGKWALHPSWVPGLLEHGYITFPRRFYFLFTFLPSPPYHASVLSHRDRPGLGGGKSPPPFQSPRKYCLLLPSLVSPALKALVDPQRQDFGKQKLKENREKWLIRTERLEGWPKKKKKMGKKSKNLKLIYILAPEANSVFIWSPRPARANSVLK